jgi:hypothetical protein
MGYTTDFSGSFNLNKQLTAKVKDYLTKFSETRRMGRNIEGFGIEGEFHVFGEGELGQAKDKSIIDYNKPPRTQPSLWCQWIPSADGMSIEWDGNEKFYHYTEWLVYLIHKILKPNGYVLNGVVAWQGEETGDVGEIIVENNKVFSEQWKGDKKEITPENVSKYDYEKGSIIDYMEIDMVLILPDVAQIEK